MHFFSVLLLFFCINLKAKEIKYIEAIGNDKNACDKENPCFSLDVVLNSTRDKNIDIIFGRGNILENNVFQTGSFLLERSQVFCYGNVPLNDFYPTEIVARNEKESSGYLIGVKSGSLSFRHISFVCANITYNFVHLGGSDSVPSFVLDACSVTIRNTPASFFNISLASVTLSYTTLTDSELLAPFFSFNDSSWSLSAASDEASVSRAARMMVANCLFRGIVFDGKGGEQDIAGGVFSLHSAHAPRRASSYSFVNTTFSQIAVRRAEKEVIGAAIYVGGAYETCVVEGCTFEHITGATLGGAIAVVLAKPSPLTAFAPLTHPTTLSLTSSTFTSLAAHFGGAVYVSGAIIALKDTTFINNSATARMGGSCVYVREGRGRGREGREREEELGRMYEEDSSLLSNVCVYTTRHSAPVFVIGRTDFSRLLSCADTAPLLAAASKLKLRRRSEAEVEAEAEAKAKAKEGGKKEEETWQAETRPTRGVLALPPSILDEINIFQGATATNGGVSAGSTLPLSGMPWGMIHWGIQTEDAMSGWWSSNRGQFQGFRATHEPSPWMGDYGFFVVMPEVGDIRWTASERATTYDRTTAVFRPDYQRLEITNKTIIGELTATERAAVFRFTYNRTSGTTRVIINCAGDSEASVNVSAREARGYSKHNSGGVARNFAQYFVVQFDRALTNGTIASQGSNAIINAEFACSGPDDPVTIRIGTSLISHEQALLNLKQEVAGTFDEVQQKVCAAWEAKVGLIEIEATADQRRTFYSCFYRTMLFPHRLYEFDASGKRVHWSPYDGAVHEGFMSGDTGFWDAFRSTFPLLSFLFPVENQEILAGFIQAGVEGGNIPEWPSPGYRFIMIGQHSSAIFADAVVKNQTNFDVEQAYKLLRHTALEIDNDGGRDGQEDYLSLGYVADGHASYAMSCTLDYSYDDWCVAQVGRSFGDKYALDIQTLTARAMNNYKNAWDPSVQFMRPKNSAGRWLIDPFDEFYWGGSYVEGGPWQVSWFVPHDPYGLADLLGGQSGLAKKLDTMLSSPGTYHTGGYGGVIHEMQEMNRISDRFGQYAHSNQPVFNYLFLYNVAGQPWKVEYWSRRVLQELYKPVDAAFAGDEDTGSMAAWYVFGSLGLFPYCPGQPVYHYTSPLFTHAVVHLPSGKDLTINAPNANVTNNHYVQKRTRNGASETRTWISHDELMAGGTLDYVMGPNALERTVTGQDLPPAPEGSK